MSTTLSLDPTSRTTWPRLSDVGPNWYATVMGTGIVATSAAGLPVQAPVLHAFARLVWLVAVALLLAVVYARTVHRVRFPAAARSHLRHPVAGNYYGAAPMALLTIGSGAVVLGVDLVGRPVALATGWTLWVLGTVAGLVCAVVVPRHSHRGAAFGGWLMPVVPPMVSAATGSVLLHQMAAGLARTAMLTTCCALLAVALVASAVVMVRIWRQVAANGVGPAALVPTLWIVLGPLGQSITAVHGLAGSTGARPFALAYGVVVWALAMTWLAYALVTTLRVRPPFGMPWWSFTFPVGTVVTGTSALAAETGATLFTWSSMALFGALVGAWVVVASLTARHGRRLLA
ncbi:MAG: hypothetical protein AAGC49_09270 [Brevundimonas sp.]